MKKKPKFLLLGWDSADWKVINPLIDKGAMPALESIINKGVMGNIATLDPPLSPMLWTSIATGKYAFKHGVHGFLEPNEDHTKLRAVTNASIQTKTIWQILNEAGYKTNVVGWWPSHPAQELNGVQVSNFYAKVPKDSKWHSWGEVPNSIYPLTFAETLNKLRVHSGELSIHQLSSFIPNYHLLSEEDGKLVNLLLNDLAECLSVHAAGTYLAEHTEWDFMAVYYNAIDHISHCFMKYHPPHLEWVDPQKYEIFNAVVEAAYRFHDLMLSRWLDLVEEDCYVMILSDHGFHSDEMRKKELPKEPAAIAREHNYLGIVALKGPGIRKDEIIFGSNLLDVCPTILSIFSLPIGKDMDGKVLKAIYETEPDLVYKSSWDTDSPQKNNLIQFENPELIQQLVDLGYVENTNFDSPAELKKTLDENNFYLARSYSDANLFNEAKIIMQKLCEDYPDNHRYHYSLSQIYIELKDDVNLELIIEKLSKIIKEGSKIIYLLKGNLAYLRNDFQGAVNIFSGVVNSSQSTNGVLEYQLATSLLKLHKYKEALVHFDNNLSFNPNNAYAKHGKGMAYLALQKYDEAVDVLIDSISITYFNPSAHYHLGLAFKGINAFVEAEQAFLLARKLGPRMAKARIELLNLYKNELKDEVKHQFILDEMKEKTKDVVYIVSGLPRSGTSMMMQVLAAAGLEVFTDEKREANIDNPHGYYEHEAVKRLASDNKIIYEAKDKVVKVIINLLKYLPANCAYKIIIMKRDVQEVLSSQEKMLQHLNKIKEGTTVFEMDQMLAKSYELAIQDLKKLPNVSFMELNYAEMLENSEICLNNIEEFLGLPLNKVSALEKVDTSLYRNKK
jgi:predicted AlkP superfamily phosphohydrolase/phosphomutase/tetratricopeptide (TPR) repeat protein